MGLKTRDICILVGLFLILPGITGCATHFSREAVQTRLQVKQLGAGIYRVQVYEGNFTSYSIVERAVLSKAASLATENGYERFVLLPDDQQTRSAEASGSIRKYAQSGKWGGLEGFSTIKLQRYTINTGGIPVNRRSIGGSAVVVMFKQNEKTVSKGVDAKQTLTRLNPSTTDGVRRTGFWASTVNHTPSNEASLDIRSENDCWATASADLSQFPKGIEGPGEIDAYVRFLDLEESWVPGLDCMDQAQDSEHTIA